MQLYNLKKIIIYALKSQLTESTLRLINQVKSEEVERHATLTVKYR